MGKSGGSFLGGLFGVVTSGGEAVVGTLGGGTGTIAGGTGKGGAMAQPRMVATLAKAFRIGGPNSRGEASGECGCSRASISDAVCWR